LASIVAITILDVMNTNTLGSERSGIPDAVEQIDAEMAHVLAHASEYDRLRAGFRMWTAARSVIRAAIVAEHTDWSTDRVDRELAVRMSHGLVAGVSD
jgi:hypothetical protein